MAIIQKHLDNDVASGGAVVINLPFSPDIYDQAAARLCSISAEVSMYSGAYSLTWGGGSVVVKNTGSLWPKDSDIFLYLPDVINGDYIGIGDYMPLANRAFYIKNAYPFIDRDGRHDGPAQLRQFAEVVSGTVTLYHPSITGSETIASSGGDATVSVVAGGIVIGVGKAWAINDSAGHHWSHCAALSPTSVVMWDVGLGDHLVAEGLAESVVTALCSTGRDLTVGTDWLDRGFTLADGNQYLHPVSGGLIPDEVIIPKLGSSVGCCAFVVVGG